MDLSCTTRQSTIQCFLQLLSYGIAYYLATENKSPTWRLLLQIQPHFFVLTIQQVLASSISQGKIIHYDSSVKQHLKLDRSLHGKLCSLFCVLQGPHKHRSQLILLDRYFFSIPSVITFYLFLHALVLQESQIIFLSAELVGHFGMSYRLCHITYHYFLYCAIQQILKGIQKICRKFLS